MNMHVVVGRSIGQLTQNVKYTVCVIFGTASKLCVFV